MSKNGGPINADRLKSFIDRIERMEEERKAIGGDIRDIYSEAKGVGYDVKAMRKIVALRRQDAADRAEAEAILDIYKHALGMDTSATVVTVQPSEEELEERASRIVREVDRCMALVENGRLPRIVDIKELIGCSTGKAGKLRGLVAERISRSNAIHRENPENENPPHDAETGELVDDGGKPAADVPRETAMPANLRERITDALTERYGAEAVKVGPQGVEVSITVPAADAPERTFDEAVGPIPDFLRRQRATA